MSSTHKRLQKELKNIKTSPPSHCTAGPVNDDIYRWSGTIFGPEGTPYNGGMFNVDIIFPSEYPLKPPKIKFTTKIYHPNIDENGNICLDILKQTWSPALSITKVLLSITSLLSEPNADDPLCPDIAELYNKNRSEYNNNAIKWTLKYAS